VKPLGRIRIHPRTEDALRKSVCAFSAHFKIGLNPDVSRLATFSVPLPRQKQSAGLLPRIEKTFPNVEQFDIQGLLRDLSLLIEMRMRVFERRRALSTFKGD